MRSYYPLLFYVGILLFVSCAETSFIDGGEPLETINSEPYNSLSQDVFYYYFDEKIFLTERRDLIFVEFKDELAKDNCIGSLAEQYNLHYFNSKNLGFEQFKDNGLNIVILQSNSGEISRNTIESIKKNCPEIIDITYITEHNGHYSAASNRFMVELYDESDFSKLQQYLSKYSCAIIDNPWLGDDVYLISVPKSSSYTSIELANIFMESGDFKSSSPDLYVFNALQSNDLYYDTQWYLNNVGQYGPSGIDIDVETAWAITEGSEDVVVAVIDTGVDLTHPDLQGQLLSGYDALSNSTMGGVGGDTSEHGTRVAGIISAIKDNNIGIAGVAPGCKLLPIRALLDEYFSFSAMIAAINWAVNNNADIINCSWHAPEPNVQLTNAIAGAVDNGRNGKGCVVVFASGNFDNAVTYPARLPEVMAVGALDINNTRKQKTSMYNDWGSCYGPNIDVMAPGVMISTTNIYNGTGFISGGMSDFSDPRYTKLFSGTSAAAPQVSGIAALILSKYPNLTQAQVRRAIELGCSYIPNYNYQPDSNYPSMPWNQEVGYGRVNAYNALVQAAQINQQNLQENISGIDFILTNSSSYYIDQIYVALTGEIEGETVVFFQCDIGGIDSSDSLGYPVYVGENINAIPGTMISDLELEIWATTPNYSGAVRIGAAIDNQYPNPYYDCTFGDGNTSYISIADTSVPDSSRRTLYVNIINPF